MQHLHSFVQLQCIYYFAKNTCHFCKEEQEELEFHSCWAHILRTVGPVFTFAF